MRINSAEREAIRESGLTAFFFKKSWVHISIWERAWKVVRLWPEIYAIADRTTEPTVFNIPIRSTKIEKYSLTRDL